MLPPALGVFVIAVEPSPPSPEKGACERVPVLN